MFINYYFQVPGHIQASIPKINTAAITNPIAPCKNSFVSHDGFIVPII